MNQPPQGIQDYIHTLEAGAGRAVVRWILGLLFTLGLLALYLFTEARNFHNPEAMDRAQLARNLAAGRGYTTLYIRPLSVQLQMARAEQRGRPDPLLLRQPHRDISNPPVQPVLLAGVFKLLPERFRSGLPGDLIRSRPPAEIALTGFNLACFGLAIWLTYQVGRRIFDPGVAGFAAATLAATELFWRMSSNGLDTPLLLVWLMLAVWLLWQLDVLGQAVRPHPEPPPPAGPTLRRALGVGALLGLGCLTRYSFGWLMLPVLAFILWVSPRRWLAALAAVAAFLLVVAPWLARNYQLSGRLFGTAGYALASGTLTYPEDRLERRIQPLKEMPDFTEYRVKFALNAADSLRNALPRLGGNWIWYLFLAGLAMPFNNRAIGRLRWLAVYSVVTLALVEAGAQTHLYQLVPQVNSENLLCLAAPLVFLFGSAFFFTLLESTHFGHLLFRQGAIGCAWFVFSLPLLTSVLPPRTYPLIEPTYRPDIIKGIAQYLGPQELMMTDLPWAVAWYGERRAINVPLRVEGEDREDFYAIHDFMSPVAALYLSPYTTEAPVRLLVTDTDNHRWGWLYLDALVRRNLPRGFPLLHAYAGSAREGHLFLADRPRWE